MAVLLITHDLGIVAGRADRVAVMYAGQIVEEAPTPRLFASPSHPYTQGLFASVPRITGPVERLKPIRGSVPPPAAWPTGCRFRPRCPKAFDQSETEPPLTAGRAGASDALLAGGGADKGLHMTRLQPRIHGRTDRLETQLSQLPECLPLPQVRTKGLRAIHMSSVATSMP